MGVDKPAPAPEPEQRNVDLNPAVRDIHAPANRVPIRLDDHNEQPLNMVDRNNAFQVDRKFYPVTCAQLSGAELLDMAGGECEREIWLRGVGSPDYKIGLGEFVKVRRGMRFYSAPKYINNSAPEPKQGSEDWSEDDAAVDAQIRPKQATADDEIVDWVKRAHGGLDGLISFIDALRAGVEELKARFANDIDSRDHAYSLLEAERQRLHAALAAAQVEIKSLKFEKEAFREAHAEKARALAAAREEIAKLTKEVMQHAINMVKGAEVLTAEKARADRAEERVMELEKDVTLVLSVLEPAKAAKAQAILARARKEGGSR